MLLRDNMNQTSSKVKIEMLSTGDEVLYGQIVDTNAAWLSDFLFQKGFLINSRFTVGDDLAQLVHAIQERSAFNDILIINGGLGPTSDDLSAQAAALANNEPLVMHQEWLIKIESYFATRGRLMPSSNRKQAMLPQSATIIDNPIGTACGFKMQINNCILFFTPGVPSEFKEMITTSVFPQIKMSYPNVESSLCYSLTTMGRTESDLATELESVLNIPNNIVVGYRAAMPIIELKLTGPFHQKRTMERLWQQMKTLVNDNLLYEGGTTKQPEIELAKIVAKLLYERDLSIIVIEQHSAGMIGYQLLESSAPIIKFEVIRGLIEKPNEFFLDLLTKNEADIALGLINFREDNRQFSIIIATKQQVLQFNLNYTGRKQHRQTEQQILASIALDALRRYLLNMPIIGPNIWLDIIQ